MKAKTKTEQPRPDEGLLPSPQDCMRVRSTRRACERCGVVPGVLHVPTRLRLRGAFCPGCCPVCGTVATEAGPLKWTPEIDLDAPEARTRE